MTVGRSTPRCRRDQGRTAGRPEARLRSHARRLASGQTGNPNVPEAWVRWSFDWTPPGPGSYQLRARATDQTGQVQPETVPFNKNG